LDLARACETVAEPFLHAVAPGQKNPRKKKLQSATYNCFEKDCSDIVASQSWSDVVPVSMSATPTVVERMIRETDE
jgi:hypothetical protein